MSLATLHSLLLSLSNNDNTLSATLNGDDLLLATTLKMTDSPAVQIPIDPKEQPILDQTLNIRDKLSLLKRDKSTYIKSQDVLALYEEVTDQVHLLNIIRKEHSKPLEQNRGLSS